MELDINLEGHHLTHEGKIAEAQEYLLQGHELIFETPEEGESRRKLLESLLKVQDRTLRAMPLPAINTTPAALAYKSGLNLWGIQILGGEGLLGGYSFFNPGGAAVDVFLFDGTDQSGKLLVPESLATLASVVRHPPTPWKLDNGLFIGVSGSSANVALLLGSIYVIRE